MIRDVIIHLRTVPNGAGKKRNGILVELFTILNRHQIAFLIRRPIGHGNYLSRRAVDNLPILAHVAIVFRLNLLLEISA